MKCVTPALEGVSSREPAPIQKPSATERTLGIRSVITRWPESSSRQDVLLHGQIVVAALSWTVVSVMLALGAGSLAALPASNATQGREP